MSKTYLITEISTVVQTPEEVVSALTKLGCTVLVAPNRGNGNKYIVTGMTVHSFIEGNYPTYAVEEFAPLGEAATE